MKVLFITDSYIIDVLGIGYLSSYAKMEGHHVDIIQTTKEDLVSKVFAYQPDILAYSVTTGKHNLYREIDNGIKRLYKKAKSVWGGPHITFFPKFIWGDDIGIRGEGFTAFPELLNRIETKESIEPMRNIALEGIIAPLRPLQDKNNLLHPDRALMYKYRENYDNPIKNVMTSFSCPYSCPYCFNGKYKAMYNISKSEIREVGNVMEEIGELRRYPLELIFFQDDVFPIYNQEWLDEFCKAYSRFRIPFHIQLRAEMIRNDRIRQLKDVGLHGLTFAIESGNHDLRVNVLNRRMSNDIIVEAADVLHRYGVRLRTENMVGIPYETFDNVMETVNLNIKCNPDIAWASLYQPYPGTELYEKCLSEKLFDGNVDNLSDSFFDTYRLKSKDAKKFVRLQKIFALIVRYPKLRYLARLLSSLPLDSLYKKIYSFVKVNLYQRRLFKICS